MSHICRIKNIYFGAWMWCYLQLIICFCRFEMQFTQRTAKNMHCDHISGKECIFQPYQILILVNKCAPASWKEGNTESTHFYYLVLSINVLLLLLVITKGRKLENSEKIKTPYSKALARTGNCLALTAAHLFSHSDVLFPKHKITIKLY